MKVYVVMEVMDYDGATLKSIWETHEAAMAESLRLANENLMFWEEYYKTARIPVLVRPLIGKYGYRVDDYTWPVYEMEVRE